MTLRGRLRVGYSASSAIDPGSPLLKTNLHEARAVPLRFEEPRCLPGQKWSLPRGLVQLLPHGSPTSSREAGSEAPAPASQVAPGRHDQPPG